MKTSEILRRFETVIRHVETLTTVRSISAGEFSLRNAAKQALIGELRAIQEPLIELLKSLTEEE